MRQAGRHLSPSARLDLGRTASSARRVRNPAGSPPRLDTGKKTVPYMFPHWPTGRLRATLGDGWRSLVPRGVMRKVLLLRANRQDPTDNDDGISPLGMGSFAQVREKRGRVPPQKHGCTFPVLPSSAWHGLLCSKRRRRRRGNTDARHLSVLARLSSVRWAWAPSLGTARDGRCARERAPLAAACRGCFVRFLPRPARDALDCDPAWHGSNPHARKKS